MSIRPEATIYTDGSCLGNPGPGGWGAVVRVENDTRQMSGGLPRTTNNRMELTGVINALSSLRGPHIVTLYTDSQYIVRAFNEDWVSRWKARGWAKADGELKNRDLWQLLDKLVARHSITWVWVKGHAGNKWNEVCDRLAQKAAQEAARGTGAGLFGAEGPIPPEPESEPPEDFTPNGQTSLLDAMDLPEDGYEPGYYDDLEDQADVVAEAEAEAQAEPAAPDLLCYLQAFMTQASERVNGISHPCGGEAWCEYCEGMEPMPGVPCCAAAYVKYVNDLDEAERAALLSTTGARVS